MGEREPSNRSMPPGTIIPELVYDDLEVAVGWLCAAFGFSERIRIGNHRAQLIFNGESLIAIGRTGEVGEELPSNPRAYTASAKADHSIMVRVEDVDSHYQRSFAHSAKIIQPPEDHPYGERQYTVEDIGGHVWTFSQSVADIEPTEWGGVWAGK